MDIARIIRLPFRYKPWRARHARLIAADMFGRAEQPERLVVLVHGDPLTGG